MSLRSLFERLHNSGSPAYQDLIQLKETLDGECWQVSEGIASSSPSEDYTSDLIKRIAVYLSGPLNQVEDSLSSRFRILQLRTLIAALALLHHLGVEELHAEPWSRLRLNISNRFSDIPRGRRRSQSLPVEKNRRARALYLARLAAQYFSLFKRSLPRPGALVEPVLGLILTGASIASGQYNNLQNVFVYFDQIIAGIPMPQREQRKITLPGIQEIVRNSISALKRHDSGDSGDVLLEASVLLREALETRVHDAPVFSKSRLDWVLTLVHRTPRLNRGFVTLGLLDCAIQLSSQSGPDTVPSELQQTVQRLAFESKDWDIRWASIEFFLSYRPSRQRQRFRIENEASLYPSTVKARIMDVLEVVYEALEADEPSLGQPEDSTSSSSEGRRH
ncbi:hypothetical protein G7Y79_00021g050120 [Physcia stellaris]|nr:hypothetical protein G7Y79_00021g050120 [Physcia stellaris]